MKNPTHIGIILDGNRRWAKARNLGIIEGHREGARNLKRIALHAFDRGVKFVTVYAFSNENWNRPPAQVRGLIRIFREILTSVEKEYKKENVALRFIGRFDHFPNTLKHKFPQSRKKQKTEKGGRSLSLSGTAEDKKLSTR
jgi:undecaprenyl diphosphate synthase